MNSKKSRNKSAFPDYTGHAVKKPEQKKRAQDMQEEIGEMITAGI